ncbi:MAG: hypothetical protein EOO04_34420 [Chitinophagaceae bacterium]|nr:MAG: hypothetical protein EOO04_34420 [Chitinophagaceae bacterium]
MERVIGYDGDDKNSVNIWNTLEKMESFSTLFFPIKLENFFELNKLEAFLTLSEETLSESAVPSYYLP